MSVNLHSSTQVLVHDKILSPKSLSCADTHYYSSYLATDWNVFILIFSSRDPERHQIDEDLLCFVSGVSGT